MFQLIERQNKRDMPLLRSSGRTFGSSAVYKYFVPTGLVECGKQKLAQETRTCELVSQRPQGMHRKT